MHDKEHHLIINYLLSLTLSKTWYFININDLSGTIRTN